jgi:hypothetical protein
VEHHSRHAIALPARVMSPTTVRIELPPQLVSRRVIARGIGPDGREVELGEGSFLSNDDAPARLELSLFGQRVTSLWLDVDDGDEAPLAIERATVVQSGHEVMLVAPAGQYAVVVGDLEATMPSYDLNDAQALVLVLEAHEATLGALVENPAFHEPTFFERSGWETIVLSSVLGLVVLWSARSFPNLPGQKLGAGFLPMLVGAGLVDDEGRRSNLPRVSMVATLPRWEERVWVVESCMRPHTASMVSWVVHDSPTDA